MQNLYTFLGGRKLTFAFLIVVILSVFVFTNKATASEFTEAVLWIFGIYSGGNVGEWLSKKNNK